MKSVINEKCITCNRKSRAMARASDITTIVAFVIFLLPKSQSSEVHRDRSSSSIPQSDVDLLEFPLNLEFLEAEFFLFGALGYGLDRVAPNLTNGGPSPIGARRANLDTLTRDIILQFGWQEVGHLRFYVLSYFLTNYMASSTYCCSYMTQDLKHVVTQGYSEHSERIPKAIVGFKSIIICKRHGSCSWEKIESSFQSLREFA